MAQPELIAQYHAGDFLAQFFSGLVLRAADRMPDIASEAQQIAVPLPQLVSRRCVVQVRGRELLPVGHIAMPGQGAGRFQVLSGPLLGAAALLHGLKLRQAVDLIGVEDGGEDQPGTLKLHILSDRCAAGIENQPALSVGPVALFAIFPIDERRTLLTVPYLGAGSGGLRVG